jgi:hypothetical protein
MKCALQSDEIRTVFQAVAVTGFRTTLGRNKKLRFGSCSNTVAFYCSLSVVLQDSDHFCAASAFAVVYGSQCTLAEEGALLS